MSQRAGRHKSWLSQELDVTKLDVAELVVLQCHEINDLRHKTMQCLLYFNLLWNAKSLGKVMVKETCPKCWWQISGQSAIVRRRRVRYGGKGGLQWLEEKREPLPLLKRAKNKTGWRHREIPNLWGARNWQGKNGLIWNMIDCVCVHRPKCIIVSVHRAKCR